MWGIIVHFCVMATVFATMNLAIVSLLYNKSLCNSHFQDDQKLDHLMILCCYFPQQNQDQVGYQDELTFPYPAVPLSRPSLKYLSQQVIGRKMTFSLDIKPEICKVTVPNR